MTNEEAKILIEIAKRVRDRVIRLPNNGETCYYRADDLAKIRKFTLQVYRGHKNSRKNYFSLLYRKNIMLLRVDTDGPGKHYNSDGSVIPAHTPHVHIFDEKNQCHDAILLPDSFRDPRDALKTMQDFLEYIHVINFVDIRIIQQEGLL